MHILLVTQYSSPEVTSCALRMDSFVRGWVAAGHRVTVLTAVPNHPEGVVHPGYRGRVVVRERRDGADWVRVWVAASPRRGKAARLLSYASFGLLATAVGAVGIDRPDVVVATSPPPVAAAAGRLLARRHRARFVLDVRDLWPAAAVAVGELRPGPAVRLVQRWVAGLYRSADLVTAATAGFAREIGHGAQVVPNGADQRVIAPDRGEDVRARLGLEGRFVVGFVGNHGVCEGLEGLLDAARLLADRPDVHVLMVGGGPRRDALRARAEGLPNVTMLEPVPVTRVGDHLAAADVLLVPLRDDPHFATRFPAKLFDAWAAGRPVLVGWDGDARRLVEETGGGTFAVSDDPAALAAEIRRLHDRDPGELAAMGAAGRRWVAENGTRERAARDLTARLERLVGAGSGRPA
jgi:colanic acid biosynthesis glycosyl transferase WcaI